MESFRRVEMVVVKTVVAFVVLTFCCAAFGPSGSAARAQGVSGADPRRTNSYDTRGLDRQPTGLLWTSEKLFALKGVVRDKAQLAPFGNIEISLPTGHLYTAPVLAGGVIHVSYFNGHGYLVLLDAADGRLKSRYVNEKTILSPLAVADGTIYVGASDEKFFAFDTGAGRERWTVRRKSYRFDRTTPAVADGVVYFGGIKEGQYAGTVLDRIFYAVEAATGRELWTFKPEDSPTSAAVGGGAVYFGADSALFALDSRTGRVKWKFKADSRALAPSLADDAVLFRDRKGELYAVEVATGRRRWKGKRLPKAATPLAVGGGAVYFGGADDSLYAVDAATGAERWRFKTKEPCAGPVLADGAVYFGCRDDTFYAVEAATGRQRWQLKANAPVLARPVIADGVLYLLDGAGYLQAMR